jgi:hypothetical protein
MPARAKPLDTFQELADSSYHRLLNFKGSPEEFMFSNSTIPAFRRIGRKVDAQREKYAPWVGYLDEIRADPRMVTPYERLTDINNIPPEYALSNGRLAAS